MSVKCLVVGDINGRFVEVFKKIASLHAKNSFAFAIIVGSFFPSLAQQDAEDGVESSSDLDALLNGRVAVPLPTYFCLGKTPLSPTVIQKLSGNNNELCENLFFLGKRTIIKTSEGVRIVALGGAFDAQLSANASKDAYSPVHNIADANSLKGANSADILVTSDWPRGICTMSKTAPDDLSDVTEQAPVSDLCATLKPRYHFSVSNSFYEREPFFHPPAEGSDDSTGYATTRFISLAPYGNTNKQKWIYAFNIDPTASNPPSIPPGTTPSPLPSRSKKRAAQPEQQEAFSRYSGSSTYDSGRHSKRRRGEARRPPPGPDECFFCLSNPALAAHLVTSIGSDSYMTTAKGPLSSASTFADAGLDVPGHMLIIPLPHAATLSSISDAESRLATVREMQRFRGAVHAMLGSVAGGKLGAVTWEVSRAQGVHAHWQILPMPAALIDKELVEAAFKVEAENEGWPAFETTTIPETEGEEVHLETGDHFSVWVWSPVLAGENEDAEAEPMPVVRRSKKLTLALDIDTFRFDLQFGRRVLAKLLGLEKRTNWRDCTQSEAEEAADAEGWKETFKTFDFSLEE